MGLKALAAHSCVTRVSPPGRGPGRRTTCCSPPGQLCAGERERSWGLLPQLVPGLSHRASASFPLSQFLIASNDKLHFHSSFPGPEASCMQLLCFLFMLSPRISHLHRFYRNSFTLAFEQDGFVLVKEGFKRTRIHLGSCVAVSAGWCCAAVEQAGSCSLLPTVRAGGLTSNPDTPFPPVFLKQNTHVCCPLAKSGFKQFI